MNSVDTLSSTRKAHSATKISEADQVLSSCDHKNNTRILCASASCYSSRERIRNSRQYYKNLFHDETLGYLKSSDSNKKKLFLYASQVLSKLKNISKKYNDLQNSLTVECNEQQTNTGLTIRKLKFSFRKVNFYYDLLKRLLEERSILLLKEESRFCVKQTQILVSDLKFLYAEEIIKLTTMPIKSYNRFIDSSGISISILEQLFKKVNYICDLHSSLKNNYQNIINFFHVGFDMELNHMLIKINKFQNHLYSEMLFWTHKVLEIFILKLCLADPDSVSPEFLHHVLETCESFNLLLFDKKHINYAYLTNTYNVLFNSFIQSDYEAVLLDFILQYLSHFEAKVAAEKIIQYLIHECKNYNYSAMKEQGNEKDKRDTFISSSNTSDYYSASPTVAEDNAHVMHVFTNGTHSFENVFLSFIQRNQSLVLKYLYSIICLDISVPSRNKNDTVENYPDSSAVNKAWNLPQAGCKNKSYLCLEERYWIRFWEKVLSFCLKLILEVPCHQYGNAAAGVFLLWPQSYHYMIFKLLKSSAENKDISSFGLNVMKKLLHNLLIHTIQESWDKSMSSALSMVHGQQSMPIPVAESRARTRIGNAFCLCLEPFGNKFLNDSTMSGNLYLHILYPFQVTLDCFIFLTNIKTRASVASTDIATYLLISRSDCVYALKLLEEKEYSGGALQPGHLRFFSSSSHWKSCVSKQIEILTGHVSEAPIMIHTVISNAIRSVCRYELKRNHWRILNFNSPFASEMFSLSSIEEVLSSITHIVNHIFDGIDVLFAVISATASSLLSALLAMQKNLSTKKIQTVKEILLYFLNWLEQLNIEDTNREKLREMKCLKKLLCIVRILESSSVKPRYFQRIHNKVSPLLIDINPEECMILTEEERLQWRMCLRKNFFPCF